MNTDKFSDLEIVALTAWGEARGLGRSGMQGVISTGLNREASGVTWWETRGLPADDTLRSIFLFHMQYSCWNENDPNRAKMFAVDQDDPDYTIALQLASDALVGVLVDNVNGADSYYSADLRVPPAWAHGLTPAQRISNLLFFKTVKSLVG